MYIYIYIYVRVGLCVSVSIETRASHLERELQSGPHFMFGSFADEVDQHREDDSGDCGDEMPKPSAYTYAHTYTDRQTERDFLSFIFLSFQVNSEKSYYCTSTCFKGVLVKVSRAQEGLKERFRFDLMIRTVPEQIASQTIIFLTLHFFIELCLYLLIPPFVPFDHPHQPYP